MTSWESRQLEPPKSKLALAILSFGIYRLFTNKPRFHRADFEEAIPELLRKHVSPSKSHLSHMQQTWSDAGYMSLYTLEGLGGGRHRIFMEVEEASIEPVVIGLVDKVTNTGDSLVDLLYVPDSVETILNRTDFKDRVIAQVSGMAISNS